MVMIKDKRRRVALIKGYDNYFCFKDNYLFLSFIYNRK